VTAGARSLVQCGGTLGSVVLTEGTHVYSICTCFLLDI